MMLIATHKDFILKHHWNRTIIIDGGECKSKYMYDGVSMLHEDQHPSRFFDLHQSYAEISRLLCAWDVYNRKLDDYVGFCQYKRQFDLDDTQIKELLLNNDAILPTEISQTPTVRDAFIRYHRAKEIDWALERIPKILPNYAEECESVLNGKALRPHNVFIMKKQHFLMYGYFLRRIFDAMDKELGYKTWEDIGVHYKLHGCFTERISNIFYRKHFKKVHSVRLTA